MNALYASIFFLFCLSGCTNNIVPSQYDVRLKSKESLAISSIGGAPQDVEITVDSRRYKKMTSEEDIFLSYHLLSADGNMLLFDNERTVLDPIDSRGLKKEKVNYTAPIEAGSYLLQVDLVEEGVTWFSEQGMPVLEIPLIVENTYIPPCEKTKLYSNITDIRMSAGDQLNVPLIIENVGNMPIYSSGQFATKLSYHLKDNAGNTLIYDGDRICLEKKVDAGDSTELLLSVDDISLNVPGSYILQVDLVIENVTWYSNQGMRTVDIPLIISE